MPTLALTIILAIMPMVLKLVAAKIEKQPSLSAVDFSLGQKYFIFQFFVVFVFNTILGAASTGTSGGDSALPVVDIFNDLKKDPSLITDWLGSAIPQQVCPPALLHMLCMPCMLSLPLLPCCCQAPSLAPPGWCHDRSSVHLL